jgi:hypothetical protein
VRERWTAPQDERSDSESRVEPDSLETLSRRFLEVMTPIANEVARACLASDAAARQPIDAAIAAMIDLLFPVLRRTATDGWSSD